MISMYDSVDVSTVPPEAGAVAGYTSGHWPTFEPFVAGYPKLAKEGRVVSIAVQADHDADALDAEPGDASAAQVPAWVERQLARHVARPIVYASVSSYSHVLGALGAAGIARSEIRVWAAHYTGRAHLCSPACGFGFDTTADATQWTDKALGRNLDESLCANTFFASTPKADPHYAWFANEPGFPERDVVMAYDRARNRPIPFIVAHRKELQPLRAELRTLARRCAHEAISHPDTDGHPSWDQFHRGFRYQGLTHRAEGRRIS